MNEPLATWLAGHGFSHGLAGYWQAGSTTLDAGGRVSVSSVGHGRGGRVVPGNWETSTLLYQLFDRYRLEGALMPQTMEEFVRETIDEILSKLPPEKRLEGLSAEQRLVGPYTIMTWPANLLTRLGKPRG